MLSLGELGGGQQYYDFVEEQNAILHDNLSLNSELKNILCTFEDPRTLSNYYSRFLFIVYFSMDFRMTFLRILLALKLFDILFPC